MDIQLNGSKNDTVTVQDAVFAADYNESLIHQIVVAYQAGERSGTVAQKTRAEVRGGGKKPWRQKGTGRARAGSSRSPVWRGGGVIFAAQPRSYKQKVNRKMYRAAMRSILSQLLRESRLRIVDSFEMDEPKTKLLVDRLKTMTLSNVLIVTKEVSINLYLASRNLLNVDVCDVDSIDPVSLIRFKQILMTVPALKHIEELLG